MAGTRPPHRMPPVAAPRPATDAGRPDLRAMAMRPLHSFVCLAVLVASACAYASVPEQPGALTARIRAALTEVGEPLYQGSAPSGYRTIRIVRLDAWQNVEWVVWLVVDSGGGVLQARRPLTATHEDAEFSLGTAPVRVRLGVDAATRLYDQLPACHPQFVFGALGVTPHLDAPHWLFEQWEPAGYEWDWMEWSEFPCPPGLEALRELLRSPAPSSSRMPQPLPGHRTAPDDPMGRPGVASRDPAVLST